MKKLYFSVIVFVALVWFMPTDSFCWDMLQSVGIYNLTESTKGETYTALEYLPIITRQEYKEKFKRGVFGLNIGVAILQKSVDPCKDQNLGFSCEGKMDVTIGNASVKYAHLFHNAPQKNGGYAFSQLGYIKTGGDVKTASGVGFEIGAGYFIAGNALRLEVGIPFSVGKIGDVKTEGIKLQLYLPFMWWNIYAGKH